MVRIIRRLEVEGISVNKAPAFQFYPRDYLEKRVLRMDLEAQGAYMQILCYMWLDSDDQYSIENDPKVISRLLGVTPAKARKILNQIQWPGDPIFLKEGDRLVSKRLRKEREQQITLSKKRKGAADKRWGNKEDANGMQTDAFALLLQCKDDANGMPFNLHLQSTSSTSINNQSSNLLSNEEEAQIIVGALEGIQTDRLIDENYQKLARWFELKCGRTSLYSSGSARADRELVKYLIKKIGLDRMIETAEEVLARKMTSSELPEPPMFLSYFFPAWKELISANTRTDFKLKDKAIKCDEECGRFECGYQKWGEKNYDYCIYCKRTAGGNTGANMS